MFERQARLGFSNINIVISTSRDKVERKIGRRVSVFRKINLKCVFLKMCRILIVHFDASVVMMSIKMTSKIFKKNSI